MSAEQHAPERTYEEHMAAARFRRLRAGMEVRWDAPEPWNLPPVTVALDDTSNALTWDEVEWLHSALGELLAAREATR